MIRFYKILQEVRYNQLISHLNNNIILVRNQYGFRDKHYGNHTFYR